MRTLGAIPKTLVLLGALLLPGPRAAALDSYEAALARSYELERSQRPEQAARLLEPLQSQYPEDYALWLRLGWLWYGAGRYEQAEGCYRQAAGLSGGSPEARLGVGWSLLEQGRASQARAVFEELVAEAPELELATVGLARARSAAAPIPFAVSLAGVFQGFDGHPAKSWAGGVEVTLGLGPWTHVVAAATYRFSRYVVVDDLEDSVGDFDQHEAYAALGLSWPVAGATLHYAYVDDGSGSDLSAHTAGLSVRWSPFGDVLLTAAVSAYDDGEIVARFEPSWRIRLADAFVLHAALALQSFQDEVLASGSLRAAYEWAWGSVWLSGRYGPEERPVYLERPAVFNSPDRIGGGGTAGLSFALGGGCAIVAGYEVLYLEQTSDSGTTVSSYGHTGWAGLTWSTAGWER